MLFYRVPVFDFLCSIAHPIPLPEEINSWFKADEKKIFISRAALFLPDSRDNQGLINGR